MPRTASNSPDSYIELLSRDPEVMALQAMIKGLQHFNSRSFTMRHLKVLMAVQLCVKAMNGTKPRIEDIATFARLPTKEFEQELHDLVEKKYLHEIVPSFGPLKIRYGIGPMGGTVLRRMMRTDNSPFTARKAELKSVK